MSMLLTLATAVNDPPADRPSTSSSSTAVIVVIAVFALLIAATVLSATIEPLAFIVATAFCALVSVLRGLVIILLALLLVLAMALSGRDHIVRSNNLPSTSTAR
ncbi:MAG: hypothetical protein M3Y48_24615 [Actinomycetota bacterium]|nr:hypothetical protein [Actinomycetota bacterium]